MDVRSAFVARWWWPLAVVACGRIEFDEVDAVDAAPPTGCAALPLTCGAAGDASCCDAALVPGGTFARSFDVASDGAFPDATHPATVSSFRLDLYEVTVGRFRQFVDAGGGTQQLPPAAGAGAHTQIAGSGWDPSWTGNLAVDRVDLDNRVRCGVNLETWTDVPGANEALPINCLAWFEAMAFCVWDGGYLPTEAEWNFAAAGGAEQRAYPWSVPATDRAIDPSRGSYGCQGDGVAGCTRADVVVPGSKSSGVARWGHADLGGNLWEWVLDANVAYVDPCTDCASIATLATRTFRGGSFFDGSSVLRSGERRGGPPTSRSSAFGVRCARP